MKLDHHCVVLGATRTGKTTTSLRLLSEQEGFRIFVNTKNESKWKKYFKYINPSVEMLDFMYNNFNKFSDGMIMLNPDISKDHPIEDLEEYLKLIISKHLNNNLLKTCIAIDEIHEFQSKSSCNKYLKKIWTMGLGIGIIGIAISQRPTHVHNDLFTNTENFILHALKQRDLEHMSEWVNIDFEKIKYPKWPGETASHTAYIQVNQLEGLKKLF